GGNGGGGNGGGNQQNTVKIQFKGNISGDSVILDFENADDLEFPVTGKNGKVSWERKVAEGIYDDDRIIGVTVDGVALNSDEYKTPEDGNMNGTMIVQLGSWSGRANVNVEIYLEKWESDNGSYIASGEYAKKETLQYLAQVGDNNIVSLSDEYINALSYDGYQYAVTAGTKISGELPKNGTLTLKLYFDIAPVCNYYLLLPGIAIPTEDQEAAGNLAANYVDVGGGLLANAPDPIRTNQILAYDMAGVNSSYITEEDITDLPAGLTLDDIVWHVVKSHDLNDFQTYGYHIDGHVNNSVSVTVAKVWQDGDAVIAHDGVSVQLQAKVNGSWANVGQAVTLDAGNDWSRTFTGLAKFEIVNGRYQRIEYRVAELTEISGYATTYSEDGLTAINTRAADIDVTVNKVWHGEAASTDVEVTLLQNGVGIATATLAADETSVVFENVPAYDGQGYAYEYSATDDAAGYVASSTLITADPAGDNIITLHNVELIDVTVKKVWDDGGDATKRDDVEVRLLADGAIIDYDGDGIAGEWHTIDYVDGNDSITFNDLPAFNESFAEITYTAEENGLVAGYLPAEDSTVDVDGNLVITNVIVPEGMVIISGEKQWIDEGTNGAYRPESITINILAGGAIVDTQTVSAENEWKFASKQLPQYVAGTADEIEYTVAEVMPDGAPYVQFGEIVENENGQFTVTNIFIPNKVKFAGLKIWQDELTNEERGIESITINLLADGEVVDTVDVSANADGEWLFDFNGADGVGYDAWSVTGEGAESVFSVVEFTITENNVEGYHMAYEIGDGVIIVTNAPEEEEIIPSGPRPTTVLIPNDLVPLTDIEDVESPLAEAPIVEETIIEEDIPLADAPQTGDAGMPMLWMALMAAAAVGFAMIRKTVLDK
ncbi:MAG: Cna B-type domain-containing protein, partial [Bacillota bacterium]|nr:Cna B-type domain-containing protein [Bacillota bacterium]